MFIGRYYHTLEVKGRVSLPKKFRDQADNWIVTRGLDGGLFVFKESEFEKQVLAVSQRTFTRKSQRDFLRLMSNDASAVQTDSLGRIQLPEYLITFGQLKKEVVVVGSFDYIEIWDRDLYHTYISTLEESAETLAESLAQSSEISSPPPAHRENT